MTTYTFGERIRHKREEAGLSQETLARQLGIARGALSMIETGKRRDRGVEKLRVLAQLLGVTADYLVGLDEAPKEEQPCHT